MGENYKTELEIELEKALDERGIYLSMMNKDMFKKFEENTLAKYPAPPERTEDLDEEDLEFLPEAVTKYKEIKEKEYEEAYKEWADKVGPEGTRAWHLKNMDEIMEELDALAGDNIPFKITALGIFKQRTAEINNFSIMYVVVCDREHPEKSYAGEKYHVVIEGIKIAKTVFPGIGEEKREQIMDIKYKNHQYKETNIGENARQVMQDISELRILKRKYAHREKVEPKDVVEDVMKLVGA